MVLLVLAGLITSPCGLSTGVELLICVLCVSLQVESGSLLGASAEGASSFIL